jgi:hypothetical protein
LGLRRSNCDGCRRLAWWPVAAPNLEECRAKAAQVIEMYQRQYPAAMKSFADDVAASAPARPGIARLSIGAARLAHLRVP